MLLCCYKQGDEKTRQSLYKLRQTWNDLFPSHKLYALDVKVKRIDPAWPITAQLNASSSNIHVNPKFLIKVILLSSIIRPLFLLNS